MRLRTMLYAPGNAERLLDKVFLAGADAVILDLEDAVPGEFKAHARRSVAAAIDAHQGDRHPIFVRVNGVSTDLLTEDLTAVLRPGLTGIKLPKVGTATDVWKVHGLLGDIEERRGLKRGATILIPTIETAMGVHNAFEIAIASTRVWCLSFGAEDYALDTGAQVTPEGSESLYARSRIVVCSRVAGLAAPLDSVFADIADSTGLTISARSGRALGFQGKSVIHPSQIPPVHAVYTPSQEEIELARSLVARSASLAVTGSGAFRHRGRLVDRATVSRAQSVISLAEHIAERSSGVASSMERAVKPKG